MQIQICLESYLSSECSAFSVSSFKDHSSPSEIRDRSYRKKLRWTSIEVSRNNRLTKILRLFIYQTGRECLKVLCLSCKSHRNRKLLLENESTVRSEDLNIYVTWAFPRMQQAWLMQIVISRDNLQIVSGLGVYQSILNPATLKISKIGYCTMLEVPCTEFSAVYKVLKLAQWLVMF